MGSQFNSLRLLGALVLVLGMGVLWNSITVIHDRSNWIVMIKKPPASYLSVIQKPSTYLSREVAKMQTTLSQSFATSPQPPPQEKTSTSARVDTSASSSLHQKNTAALGLQSAAIAGLPRKPQKCPSRYLWYLDWFGARTNNQILALINALHLSAAYGYTLLLSPNAETLLDLAIDGDGLHAHFCISSVTRDLRGSSGQLLWPVNAVPNGSYVRVAGQQGLWVGEDMFRLMPPPGFRVQVAALLLLHAKQPVWQVVRKVHQELVEGGGGNVGVHIRRLEGTCISRLNAAQMGERYRGHTEVCKNELSYVLKEVLRMGGPALQSLHTSALPGENGTGSLVARRKRGGGLQLFVAHDSAVLFQAMSSTKPLPLDLLQMARAVNGSFYSQQFDGAFESDDFMDGEAGAASEEEESAVRNEELEPEEEGGGAAGRGRRRRRTLLGWTWQSPGTSGNGTAKKSVTDTHVPGAHVPGLGTERDRVYYTQSFTGRVMSIPVAEVCAAISDDSLDKYCAKGFEPGGMRFCPPQEPWEGLAFKVATFCRAYEYVLEGALVSTFEADAAGLNSEQASLVDMLLLALSTYLVGNPSSTFTSNTVLLRNFLKQPRSSSNVDLEEMSCYGTREPAYEWKLVKQQDGRRKWTCQEGLMTAGNYAWYLDELKWSRWDASARNVAPASS